MDYTYEADIERIEGDWLVTFPDFAGAFGGGRTMRAACRRAAEALRLAIAQRISEGQELPKARFHNPPRAVFTVQVDRAYIDETGSVSLAKASRMLGVTRAQLTRFVKAGQLDTVLVGGRSRVTIASVGARRREATIEQV